MEDRKVQVILEEVNFKFKVFGEGLKGINDKLDATMEMTAKNTEDISIIKSDLKETKEKISGLEIDIKQNKEDIADMGYTMERIETKVDANARKQTDISVKTSQLSRGFKIRIKKELGALSLLKKTQEYGTLCSTD